MDDRETYFPVSRGIIEHFKKMRPEMVVLYFWLLSKASYRPPSKGVVETKAFLIGEALGWNRTKVYEILKALQNRYISVTKARSRHSFLVIIIHRFKAVPDFYRPRIPDGTPDGTPDGNPTVTPPKRNKIKPLPNRNNKEVNKGIKKTGKAEVWMAINGKDVLWSFRQRLVNWCKRNRQPERDAGLIFYRSMVCKAKDPMKWIGAGIKINGAMRGYALKPCLDEENPGGKAAIEAWLDRNWYPPKAKIQTVGEIIKSM